MSSAYDGIDFDYATTTADRANRLMSQHGVPPTPDNFSVWFCYAMGGSLTLKKTIDILIANKRKFDSAVNRDLYVTYINPHSDRRTSEDFPDQMRGVIDSAKDFLTTAISDNRTQMATLGEVSSECQAAADPRPIIEKLVKELSKRPAALRRWKQTFSRPRKIWTRSRTR
jgi:diguanylate cyclase